MDGLLAPMLAGQPRSPQRANPRAMTAAIRRSRAAIPYLAPELQLLYKSSAIRSQDQADFESAAPLLGTPARTWLRESLRTTDPNHHWLAKLTSV